MQIRLWGCVYGLIESSETKLHFWTCVARQRVLRSILKFGKFSHMGAMQPTAIWQVCALGCGPAYYNVANLGIWVLCSLVQFGKFVRLGAVLPTTMLQFWAQGCCAA